MNPGSLVVEQHHREKAETGVCEKRVTQGGQQRSTLNATGGSDHTRLASPPTFQGNNTTNAQGIPIAYCTPPLSVAAFRLHCDLNDKVWDVENLYAC